MKAVLTIVFSIILSQGVFSQSTNSVTMKSFKANIDNILMVDLGNSVEIKEWDNNHVSVQTEIKPLNYSQQQFSALLSKGFFNIVAKYQDTEMYLFYPLAGKDLMINGKSLEHEIKYVIYIPKGMQNVTITNEAVKKDDF